jgi:sulfur-oxidizing protein SoxZ
MLHVVLAAADKEAMMKPELPRIDMPASAEPDEIIMIRTKIRHPMETGWRKTSDGTVVERNRLTKFSCTFEGQEVVSIDYGAGTSQDPYFTFFARVPRAGNFAFRWEGDHDQVYERTIPIELDV